jgi:hypothetical protein
MRKLRVCNQYTMCPLEVCIYIKNMLVADNFHVQKRHAQILVDQLEVGHAEKANESQFSSSNYGTPYSTRLWLPTSLRSIACHLTMKVQVSDPAGNQETAYIPYRTFSSPTGIGLTARSAREASASFILV